MKRFGEGSPHFESVAIPLITKLIMGAISVIVENRTGQLICYVLLSIVPLKVMFGWSLLGEC